MTGINAFFPSLDARRALKGVRKIHWCRALGTYACARAGPGAPRASRWRRGFQALATYPRTADIANTSPTGWLFSQITAAKTFILRFSVNSLGDFRYILLIKRVFNYRFV